MPIILVLIVQYSIAVYVQCSTCTVVQYMLTVQYMYMPIVLVVIVQYSTVWVQYNAVQ